MDELSSAFYRSCLAVRQSGEELSEVKSYLLKELLSIAITRSVRANRQQQEAEETVRTLQEQGKRQELELTQLYGELQRYQSAEAGVVSSREEEGQPEWNELRCSREAVNQLVVEESEPVRSEHMSTGRHHGMSRKRKRRTKCVVAGRRKKPKNVTTQEQPTTESDDFTSDTGLVLADDQEPPTPTVAKMQKLKPLSMIKEHSIASLSDSSTVTGTPTNNGVSSPTVSESDREPSPEIPLQSHPRRSSTNNESNQSGKNTSLSDRSAMGAESLARDDGLLCVDNSETAVEETGRQFIPTELAELDGSKEERVEARLEVEKVKPRTKRRKRTLLNRKSQDSKLSEVDEVSASRRLTLKVNTRGVTAPKLKTGVHSHST